MNINKTDSTKIETTDFLRILGIILCSITMFLGVGVTLTIRMMNKHLHYLFNPAWFAFTLFAFSLILLGVYPSIYNFEHYTWLDMGYFFISGVVHFIHQNLVSIAYKYQEASKISFLTYSSGIWLLLSDYIIFGYKFSATDYAGILMVIAFLLLPILYKAYGMRR
mmetsp:Transcript_4176/g.3921  ORF Transcript_4176/g.3921 Transcript_4176/m.3921 type:complete len:165 (+) Transcript_4176:627-1121(+)